MKRWRHWAVLAVLGLVLEPLPALAEDMTVAILEFRGEAKLADAAREAVERGLVDWYSLASERRIQRQLERMGVASVDELDQDQEFATLGTDIRAQAIIEGEVTRTGRIYTLELRVRWSETGAVLEQASVELSRRKRLSRKHREAVSNQALDLITKFTSARERALAAAHSRESSEDQAEGEEGEGGGEEGEGDQANRGTGTEGEARGGSEPAPDQHTPASSGSKERPVAALSWVAAGVSLWQRDLSLAAAAGGTAPPGYSTDTPAAGVRLEGELYPLGSSRHALLAGIGVGLTADRTLAMTTNAGMQSHATAAMRLGGGLRYVYPLGEGPTATALKVSLGYGMLSFDIDSGAAAVAVPDVAYGFVEAGAGLVVPLGARLAMSGNLTYMHILSQGEIADMGSYGPGGALAFGANLSAQYLATSHLLVRAGLHYTRVSLSFDTATQGATGAADSYLGAFAAAGLVF